MEPMDLDDLGRTHDSGSIALKVCDRCRNVSKAQSSTAGTGGADQNFSAPC